MPARPGRQIRRRVPVVGLMALSAIMSLVAIVNGVHVIKRIEDCAWDYSDVIRTVIASLLAIGGIGTALAWRRIMPVQHVNTRQVAIAMVTVTVVVMLGVYLKWNDKWGPCSI